MWRFRLLKFSHVFLFNLLLFLISIIIISIYIPMNLKLISVDYKVFGRVQGVFFRKFTEKRAKELNIKGWVANSLDGTVVGTIEGEEQPILDMKQWLSTTGSPYSKISRCDFTNERIINEYQFNDFRVRH